MPETLTAPVETPATTPSTPANTSGENPYMALAKKTIGKAAQDAPAAAPQVTPTPPTPKSDPMLSMAKGKQEAKPAPTAPVVDDPLKSFENPPEGISDKGKVSWKEFHAKAAEIRRQAETEASAAKAAREEAATLKRQYEETVGKYGDYEEKNKRLTAAEQRLEILDFENHPKFIENFKRPAADAAEAMQNAINAAGQKIEVSAMLAMTAQERRKVANEIIEKLSPIERTEFTENLFRLEKIERDASVAVKDRQRHREEWKTQELARAQQVRQMDEAVFSLKYRQNVSEKVKPVEFSESDPADVKEWGAKWNESLKTIEQEARLVAFKPDMTPEQVADVSLELAVNRHMGRTLVPALAARVEASEAKVAELQAKLDAIEKARPGYTPAGVSDGAPNYQSMTHEQRAKAMLGARR